MNILQLIYVLEVAKYHNVSKAASRLYLSQSALSQQISRLEKELGYELFFPGFPWVLPYGKGQTVLRCGAARSRQLAAVSAQHRL